MLLTAIAQRARTQPLFATELVNSSIFFFPAASQLDRTIIATEVINTDTAIFDKQIRASFAQNLTFTELVNTSTFGADTISIPASPPTLNISTKTNAQFQPSGTTTSLVATSLHPSDMILLVCHIDSLSGPNPPIHITSISGTTAGAFTKRIAVDRVNVNNSDTTSTEFWWVKPGVTLTNDPITVTFSTALGSNDVAEFTCVSVSGTALAFDSHAGLPAHNQNNTNFVSRPQSTISTSQAALVISITGCEVAFVGDGVSPNDEGYLLTDEKTDFSGSFFGRNIVSWSKGFSTAQTSLLVTGSSHTTNVLGDWDHIADAIIQ